MMEKGRALAFQVSEELFRKVKEYLACYTLRNKKNSAIYCHIRNK